ncbi:MAG: hypothetical protein CBB66_00945 [bacterium TMED6]|nr:MAG: hypothetical protein CBB66_00945 [bacterium TMED6]
MKVALRLLFCVAVCQKQNAVFFNLNQNTIKNQIFINIKKPYNIKHKRTLLLNQSFSNWFYAMGPYNDIWGSDILKVDKRSINKAIIYYPLNNFIISFRPRLENNNISKNRSAYINVLGFNLKKFKV